MSNCSVCMDLIVLLRQSKEECEVKVLNCIRYAMDFFFILSALINYTSASVTELNKRINIGSFTHATVFFRCSAPEIPENPFNKQVRKIERILIEGDVVLVGFRHCVISLPLRWCSPHLCRSSCLRSSDPYCAWNKTACVSVVHPSETLEQNVNLDHSAALSAPCQSGSEVENNPLQTTDEKADPTLPNVPGEEVVVIKEEESHLKKGNSNSLIVIIIVAVGTAALTALFVTLVYCCCCNNRKRKPNDEENFIEKQMQVQHPMAVQSDEKQTSLSRKAHRTFCGMKYWFWKTTTPVHSPEIPAKHDVNKRYQRRSNDYTPAPTVAITKNFEKPRINRIMSSRLNSTSSVTSREDSLRYSAISQPLLPSQSKSSSPDPGKFLLVFVLCVFAVMESFKVLYIRTTIKLS